MSIYKFTLLKFLKSFSTWLPLSITLLIVALIGVILPFSFLDLDAPSVIQTYKLYVVASVTTIGSATSIVSATFAAYKSVQIYKQEIEEGTFLVLVSKPINRRKIIFEKWLALFTIISMYVIILILFYVFLVLIVDPGPKIANLDISPIKERIFAVGGILTGVILMLTLMFSSIALILSSKLSSSATIALVAGMGAIIPITGLIPTFTNKQPQTMITIPTSPLNATRVPRDKTINFIQEIIKDEDLNKINIINLFTEANASYETIETNKDNKYVVNLGVNSGERDVYGNLFYLDFNYQLSSIATIASDLLISKSDSNYLSAGAMISGFNQNPTLTGEIKVTQSNIKIIDLSKMILNTLKEYKLAVESESYGNGVYPFFDYILEEYNIKTAAETNKDNFYLYFLQLLSKFKGKEELEKFLSSPIISTILKDNKVSESLKKQLQNKDNPYFGEIKGIESLLLMKINMELGGGLNLIISSKFLNDFYNKVEIEKFVDVKTAEAYLNILSTNNDDLKSIINDFSQMPIPPDSLPEEYNILIKLANTLLLAEKANGGINSFEFGDYANKWILFGIYSSITFLLLPTSYLIIKKQDIK